MKQLTLFPVTTVDEKRLRDAVQSFQAYMRRSNVLLLEAIERREWREQGRRGTEDIIDSRLT